VLLGRGRLERADVASVPPHERAPVVSTAPSSMHPRRCCGSCRPEPSPRVDRQSSLASAGVRVHAKPLFPRRGGTRWSCLWRPGPGLPPAGAEPACQLPAEPGFTRALLLWFLLCTHWEVSLEEKGRDGTGLAAVRVDGEEEQLWPRRGPSRDGGKVPERRRQAERRFLFLVI
jgi:hypothetical protein